MPDSLPVPGRVEPTRFRYDRTTVGATEDWRPPKKRFQTGEDRPGTLICPRCHAISNIKRWFFDEQLYQQLKDRPNVEAVTCPGCERLDRQIYEGEVHLRSPLLARNKPQALGLIRNQEREAMHENPISRIGVVQDHGEEIAVFTTTRFLAERIGKEFKKAFDGHLRVDRLPREKAARVYWERA